MTELVAEVARVLSVLAGSFAFVLWALAMLFAEAPAS